MAAQRICFDFYYRPKPSKIRQNGSAAAADARLTTAQYKNPVKTQVLVNMNSPSEMVSTNYDSTSPLTTTVATAF